MAYHSTTTASSIYLTTGATFQIVSGGREHLSTRSRRRAHQPPNVDGPAGLRRAHPDMAKRGTPLKAVANTSTGQTPSRLRRRAHLLLHRPPRTTTNAPASSTSNRLPTPTHDSSTSDSCASRYWTCLHHASVPGGGAAPLMPAEAGGLSPRVGRVGPGVKSDG